MALNEDVLNNFEALEPYCLMFDIATSLALNSANSNFIHGSFERSFPKHVFINCPARVSSSEEEKQVQNEYLGNRV